jgi:tetratricopeptide (TPR) repeat protein
MSDAAIQVLQKAVKYNPACPSQWRELGRTLKRYGDLNGAIQTYLGENPRSPLLWDCLGEAYLEKGEVTNATETYRNAIDKNLSNAYLPLRLGDIYFSQCEYKSAIDAYERASMNGGEEMMYVYACRGSTPYTWNRQEIDSQLYSSFLWYNLHKAHIANGNFKAAIKPYDQAIVVYEAALRGSARRLEWIHHPEGVSNSGFNLTGILPDIVILCALGEIYRARGDMEKSTASFKRALASKPNNRWLQHVVSDISEEMVKDK